ncbi:hypothetical protein [Sphingomonas azotifigens]|uniref:hypothetical protein n=1 Tax=Sphingomonas azotifigens TaxID=330920 RepID=UPI0009FD3EDF|nr:hypothetical protein [Sphingomonas azotifigens]
MAKQSIYVGAAANDGTGDSERAAWIKANANFDELYDAAARLPKIEKTVAYTATSDDCGKSIRADASGGGFTVTLPASAVRDGDFLRVQKGDASTNRVTVRNAASSDIAWLSAPGDAVWLVWWKGAWEAFDWRLAPLRLVFASSGTSTKPPLATALEVMVVGAGGGGGSGRCGASGTVRTGGGGGGGGMVQVVRFPAAAHGATESVTIGAGGSGGVAAGSGGANGFGGGSGGGSSLGGLLRADGGNGGGSGQTTNATGGLSLPSGTFGPLGSGGISTSANASGGGVGGGTGGGAGGASIDASNNVRAAAAGGGGSTHCASPAAGGAAGTASSPAGGAGGAADPNLHAGGGGGGGGYSGNLVGAGGAGGMGGAPGGGGGGGGASDVGFASGAGGTGGRGEVRITWTFG